MANDLREAAVAAGEKFALRRRFLAERCRMTPAGKQAADAAICAGVRRMEVWRDAVHVALYAAMPGEPDLSELLREPGKRFYFPRYQAESGLYELVETAGPGLRLLRGKFGIPEPAPALPAAPASRIAEMLILAPAVACDAAGTRLGRGGGFYDRLLTGKPMAVVATVYACQMTENLPREAHDCKVDFCVTEKDILSF